MNQKYVKDFDTWNKEKIQIEQVSLDRLSFHEREIWWCSMGLNIGDEEDGKNELFERPILVLRKFNKKIAWILPLSTKIKTGDFYHTIDHDGRTFSVLLSQVRLLSVKRFRRYIRKISPHQASLIKEKFIKLLQ